jgi:hypothetical protein
MFLHGGGGTKLFEGARSLATRIPEVEEQVDGGPRRPGKGRRVTCGTARLACPFRALPLVHLQTTSSGSLVHSQEEHKRRESLTPQGLRIHGVVRSPREVDDLLIVDAIIGNGNDRISFHKTLDHSTI